MDVYPVRLVLIEKMKEIRHKKEERKPKKHKIAVTGKPTAGIEVQIDRSTSSNGAHFAKPERNEQNLMSGLSFTQMAQLTTQTQNFGARLRRTPVSER